MSAVVEVLIDGTDHELRFCIVFIASESVGVCIDLIDGRKEEEKWNYSQEGFPPVPLAEDEV